MDRSRKWLVGFNAGKTQLVLFDQSDNTASIDVKMDGSVLEGKLSFKIQWWTFSSKLDYGINIIAIAKTNAKKIGAFICSMKFFRLRLVCISINPPCNHEMLLSCLSWCS